MKKQKAAAADAQALLREALALLLKSRRLYEKGIAALDVEEQAAFDRLHEPGAAADASIGAWQLIEARSLVA